MTIFQSLRSISTVALSLLIASEAFACRPLVKPYVGFFHASDKQAPSLLPSNARGALFVSNEEDPWQCINDDGVSVCGKLPSPLSGKSFHIDDLGTKRTLHAAVKRIEWDDAEFLPPPGRKFLSIIPRLTKCLVQYNSDDSTSCRRLGIDFEHQGWSKSLLKKGYIVEVTKEFDSLYKQSHGYFLVAPRDGFKANHLYVMDYLTYLPDNRFPSRIELRIGASPLTENSDSFLIVPQGHVERRIVGYGLCGGGGAAATEASMQYQIPKRYEPYSASLFFITTEMDHPHTGSNHAVDPIDESVRRLATQPNSRQFVVDGECKGSNEKPSPIYVKGAVGLLEVSSTLHKAPVAEVTFEHATGPSCKELTQQIRPPVY